MKNFLLALVIALFIVPNSVYAWEQLSEKIPDMKTFAINYSIVVAKVKGPNNPSYVDRFRLVMGYHEDDRKAMRFSKWGLEDTEGKIDFYETATKNNGFYVSSNEQGKVDAVIIEVARKTENSYWVTYQMVENCLASLLLSGFTFPENEKAINEVIDLKRVFVDINSNDKCIRIKNVSTSSPEFHNIVIYRVK